MALTSTDGTGRWLSDRALSFRQIHGRPRPLGIVRLSTAAHDYGRRLQRMDRILSRRTTPSGHAPPLPPDTSTQLATCEQARQAVLPGTGNRIRRVQFHRGKQEGLGGLEGRRRSG